MAGPDTTPTPPPVGTPPGAPTAEPIPPQSGPMPPGADPSAGSEKQVPPPPFAAVIDAAADLMQLVVDWMRQQAGDIMREKVVLPGQKLGLAVASAMAAATLFVVGLLFIFVAILLVLAELMGWPAALLTVGGVILLGAGIFTYIKVRSLQK